MRPRAQSSFSAKRRRLAKGEKPRVLDICGGAGGFSLGFKSAGYELLGAVEFDALAVSTYALNLHKGSSEGDLDRLARPRDLSTSAPSLVARDLKLGRVSESVDVILAGLPCQAFARIGRSKLGSVADDPEAYRTDPRASLYRRFLTYVRAFEPLAIVLENVPDILNHGGHNVPEEISTTLSSWGYRCRYSLLNAAAYGVPQLRERLFLIALHESLGNEPVFPLPTHRVDVPLGYANARRFALKNVDVETSHYVAPPLPVGKLPDAVTVRDAIADLAPIRRGDWRIESGTPSRNVIDRSTYIGGTSGYARLMRRWRGFASEGSVDAHVVRHTPRDYSLFRDMVHGEQYPEMHRRAVARFMAEVDRLRIARGEIGPQSDSWAKLQAAMVPPYDPQKFPNKWRKLEPDRPSCTLTAHLGKDAYSHIHYDSDQARTISVREAARLQSFPDGYVFSGAMNSAFRQIGNAVPPLMSQAIAIQLAELLGVKSTTCREPTTSNNVKAAA